jgi:hypothetical protein
MNTFKTIELIGKRYDERNLTEWRKKMPNLEQDWFEAMLFFFSRAFMRGRRDEVSMDFLDKAVHVLNEWRPRLLPGLDSILLDRALLGPLVNGKSNGVSNKHDRRLVCDTLKFIVEGIDLTPYDRNVVKYAIANIDRGKAADVFERLDLIHAVGDKIASFFLRDVAIMWGLESHLRSVDRQYFQPLDTWVFKVVKGLSLPATNGKDNIDHLSAEEKIELEDTDYRQL